MKSSLFLGLLLFAFVSLPALRAEDAKKPDEKAGDAKAAEVKADDKPKEIKTGTLSEKPMNAAEGVVAVLTVKSGDDKQDKKAARKAAKRGGVAPATEQKLNLLATGDLATKLSDLAKKSALVAVTGTVNYDALTMKATDVTEQTPTDTGKRKGKGKNK